MMFIKRKRYKPPDTINTSLPFPMTPVRIQMLTTSAPVMMQNSQIHLHHDNKGPFCITSSKPTPNSEKVTGALGNEPLKRVQSIRYKTINQGVYAMTNVRERKI